MKSRRARLALAALLALLVDALAAGCGGGVDCGGGTFQPGNRPSGEGSIYITDRATNRLIMVDPDDPDFWDERPGQEGPLALEGPGAICLDGLGRIYIIDKPRNRIVRIDDMSGRGLVMFGGPGSGQNQFRDPEDIYVDGLGQIYVADTGNNRIVRFSDMTGASWRAFGLLGDAAGQFDRPIAICTDRLHRIYVGDQHNGRIVRMSSSMDGSDWEVYDQAGGVMDVSIDSAERIVFLTLYPSGLHIVQIDNSSGDSRQAYPVNVHVQKLTVAGGRIYAGGYSLTAPSTEAVIFRMDDISGAGRIDFTGEGFARLLKPRGIAAGANGAVYFTDGRLFRMDDMAGSNRVYWDRPISDRFSSPGGGFLRGAIYLADTDNHRIVMIPHVLHGTDWQELGSFGDGYQQFNQPLGVYVEEVGLIMYVADAGNNRIVRTTMSGEGWQTYGSAGSGVGQFNRPAAIWKDVQNRIYVADSGNSRIVRLDDMTGANWTALGSPGSGERQFNGPLGISLDSLSRILVSDTGNHRIVRMDDMDGAGWISGSGPEGLNSPSQICCGADGFTYAADRGNHRYVRFSEPASGDWTTFGTRGGGFGQFEAPYGIFTEPAVHLEPDLSISVSPHEATIFQGGPAAEFTMTITGARRFSGNVILKADVVGGNVPGVTVTVPSPSIVSLPSPEPQKATFQVRAVEGAPTRIEVRVGALYPEKNVYAVVAVNITTGITDVAPYQLASDTRGSVYVADGFSRILRSNTINGPFESFGTQGSGAHQFAQPIGVAIDRANRIYVADTYNHRIVRMDDMTGANWTTIGSLGNGVAQFNTPSGIAVFGGLGGRAYIYVADRGNHRIVRLTDMQADSWSTVGRFGTGIGELKNPSGVSLDGSGRVYTSDSGNHRVVRLEWPILETWVTLGSQGSGALQFSGPYQIYVNEDNRVFVADFNNHRIVRFNNMLGEGWTAYGAAGSGVGQFQFPIGVVSPHSNEIYVADNSNDRLVFVSDMAGTGWKAFPP